MTRIALTALVVAVVVAGRAPCQTRLGWPVRPQARQAEGHHPENSPPLTAMWGGTAPTRLLVTLVIFLCTAVVEHALDAAETGAHIQRLIHADLAGVVAAPMRWQRTWLHAGCAAAFPTLFTDDPNSVACPCGCRDAANGTADPISTSASIQ